MIGAIAALTLGGCIEPSIQVMRHDAHAAAIGRRLAAIRSRAHGAMCGRWTVCMERASQRCADEVAPTSRPIHMVFQDGYAGWNCTIVTSSAEGAE